MLRLAVMAAALLVGGAPAYAQGTTSAPPIGATSPLGSLGSAFPTLQSGIPLGATEIDPGGLSPLPCAATGTLSSPTAGTGSTFDGGGSIGTATGMLTAGPCGSASGPPASAGIASPLSTPGRGPGFALNGGTIPLGATEIGGPGLSPIITVPGPTLSLPDQLPNVGPIVPPSSSSSSSACVGSAGGASASSTSTGAATGSAGVTSLSGSTATGSAGATSLAGGMATGITGMAASPSCPQ